MPEPKHAKKAAQPKPKTYAAQTNTFLDDLQIVPNESGETAPKTAGQPQGTPQAKPTVVKLIDFIKKM